jgi:acetyl-CoA acetyltransferase
MPLLRLRWSGCATRSVTDIPITNVTNNCTTGSTALFPAATLTRAGDARCALALGLSAWHPVPSVAARNDSWSGRPSPTRPASRRGPSCTAAAAAASQDMRIVGRLCRACFGAAVTECFRIDRRQSGQDW